MSKRPCFTPQVYTSPSQHSSRATPQLLLLILLGVPMMGMSQQKVLHYTETTGYNHNTKTQSLSMFNSWAAALNYTVTNDDEGDEFDDLVNLMSYDVVVWSNTSGSGGLNAAQRANFETYIANGGSYLGIHAASDTYRHSTANGGSTGNWDWYAETVAGASVQTSPNHTKANHTDTMTLISSSPILDNIPNPWVKTEEYYYWEDGYLDTTFTELLRVGQTGNNSYDAPRMMAHIKELPGGGRSFYTALGHSGNNYTSDQNFQNLIEDALIWILGADPVFPVSIVNTRVQGPTLCWELSELSDVYIETISSDALEFVTIAQQYNTQGCYTFQGCDPVVARIRAKGEDGIEATSRRMPITPKPLFHMQDNVFQPDCAAGSLYRLMDLAGRQLMAGMIPERGVNLQSLGSGLYLFIVGENSYQILR